MLRKIWFCLAVAVLVSPASLSQAFSQERSNPTVEETTLTAAAPAPGTGNAFVIMCDSRPNQFIVLDAQGKWMSTVQSATVSIEIGKSPTITCVMWAGLFKPTNPETKVWVLSQMKSVDAQQFQKYVDQLQTDPNAIARSVSGTGQN